MDRRRPRTEFGPFPEATLDGLVAAIDTRTRQASAVSGLPPAYFGIHGSEVASADAIRSSEATLVSQARRRQRALGGAWEDVLRLAVLVRDGVQRPGMESLETIRRDPETRTVAQAADAAVKKLAVGVSREQVLEGLGSSPVPIQRMTSTSLPDPLRTVVQETCSWPRPPGKRPTPTPTPPQRPTPALNRGAATKIRPRSFAVKTSRTLDQPIAAAPPMRGTCGPAVPPRRALPLSSRLRPCPWKTSRRSVTRPLDTGSGARAQLPSAPVWRSHRPP